MENKAIAKLTHVRISSRKVKIVIDLIRNKPVGVALAILKNTPKAASEYVEKLLLSAIANAENNHNMDVESLYVAEIYADQGPTLKRIRPRAQGRAFRINKRTSHITIVLKERAEVLEAKKAEQAKKKATKKTTKKDTAASKADATVAEKPKKPRAPRKTAAKKAEEAETTSVTEETVVETTVE